MNNFYSAIPNPKQRENIITHLTLAVFYDYDEKWCWLNSWVGGSQSELSCIESFETIGTRKRTT